MTTLSDIAQALLDALSDIEGVDQSSISDYLPAVTTRSAALLIPLMLTQSVYGYTGMEEAGTPSWQSHRMQAEFWVKHTGSNSDLVERVRVIQQAAPLALAQDMTLGGTVDTLAWTEDGENLDYRIITRTDNELVMIGGAPYLRVTVEVAVTIL